MNWTRRPKRLHNTPSDNQTNIIFFCLIFHIRIHQDTLQLHALQEPITGIKKTVVQCMIMAETRPQLELPGFRFHPTEEELLQFYLKTAISGKKLQFDVIGFLNIYHYEPSALPGLAKIGEREWYFYVQRDRKRTSGGRPNRITETGFWKATGSDRRIFSLASPKRVIGLRKTLVFYTGKAPRGCKTDWVMNEYRLPEFHTHSDPGKDIVLCKIYRKATSLKVLEQRAAVEDELELIRLRTPLSPSVSSQCDLLSAFNAQLNDQSQTPVALKLETESNENGSEHETELTAPSFFSSSSATETAAVTSNLKLPIGMDILPDLQVSKTNVDWTQDQFWTQFDSPWIRSMTLNLVPY